MRYPPLRSPLHCLQRHRPPCHRASPRLVWVRILADHLCSAPSAHLHSEQVPGRVLHWSAARPHCILLLPCQRLLLPALCAQEEAQSSEEPAPSGLAVRSRGLSVGTCPYAWPSKLRPCQQPRRVQAREAVRRAPVLIAPDAAASSRACSLLEAACCARSLSSLNLPWRASWSTGSASVVLL